MEDGRFSSHEKKNFPHLVKRITDEGTFVFLYIMNPISYKDLGEYSASLLLTNEREKK